MSETGALHTAELEGVTTRARVCGRPVACYMREVSLGRRLKGTNAVMSNTVPRELARVATRLRGLGLVAEERDLPEAAKFDAALQEGPSIHSTPRPET